MSQHIKALANAWQHRHQNTPSNKPAIEQAFLPAALEIYETPPSPLGRVIAYSVILVFMAALLWATLGKVDVVSVALGKTVPLGNTKIIQALEIGTVKAIHIKEGQQVKAGDTLLELDSSQKKQDYLRLSNDIFIQQAEQARLLELIRQIALEEPDPNATLNYPEKIPLRIQQRQQQLFAQLLHNYLAKKVELTATVAQQQAEYLATEESVNKQKSILPIITQRVKAWEKLLDKKMAAEMDYLELRQQQVGIRQDMRIEQHRLQEISQQIKQVQAQRQQQVFKTRSEWLASLSISRQKIIQSQHELEKVKTAMARLILRSPVNGVVQQLDVHTLGGVVTPAQPIMKIVPDNYQLFVEAYLSNKDIGFVSEGDVAKIKIDAFPYTKYGMLDAQVVTISDDAIEHEQKGLVFPIRLSLGQDFIPINGKNIKLIPGMSVSAEIKTGSRRVIEFFLAPILRYQSESVRER